MKLKRSLNYRHLKKDRKWNKHPIRENNRRKTRKKRVQKNNTTGKLDM